MKTRLTIRNCAPMFRFQCPELWSELTPTQQVGVRHCAVCDADVYICTSDEETIEHARAGHCIAREIPDETELPAVVVGMPDDPPLFTARQREAARWSMREGGIDDSIKNVDSERACPQCKYPAPWWRATCRVCGFPMGRAMKE